MANITNQEATCIVKDYYTDYAKYVLETRALPSIYDGFKHAQRRLVLVGSTLPTKNIKSANILGSTIPYHPHGLDSLYSTLVGMTTTTNQFRLFKGKGNWGGAGFGAAAYRYTEAYLENYARFCYTQFLNYADYEQGESGLDEPKALPALVPYSNVVGSSGIGVGLSTNIMPLNLMELIDYYLSMIKGEEPKAPTPDVGNFVLDMDDSEIDDASTGIDGKLIICPVITQESDNTIVIEGLYNKDISKICDKIGDLLDSGKVDFRDESSSKIRYVFEICDSSVSISELIQTLSKYTVSRMTFTRLVVDNDTAVYCNLKYQATKTLEYLNKVLDTKFKEELIKLQFTEKVLLAVEYIKSSGLINRLSSLSTDELKSEIAKGGFDPEVIKVAIAKPITYLTKSHMNELQSIRDEISANKSVDRQSYLIDLYTKFRDMMKPLYDSYPHTIRKSQLLTTPRVQAQGDSNILISNNGLDFKDSLVAVTKSGYAVPMSVYSTVKRTITLQNITDLCDIATDKTTDVIVLLTNKKGILAVEYSRLTYEKQLITLDDNEYVSRVLRVKYNKNGEALFDYGKLQYDATKYLRVKVAKPFRNWTL